MVKFSIPDFPIPQGRQFDDLVQLFTGVHTSVCETGQPRLVSITLEVPHLEPLAVLESIYEPGEWHAYFENQAEDWAVAGAEAVVLNTFSGNTRCGEARTWVQSILDNAILAGDLDSPYAGPHAFYGMAFAAAETTESAFAPLTAWVPRWMVYRNPKTILAMANAWMEVDTDIHAQAERIWRAHHTFTQFDYTRAKPGDRLSMHRIADVSERTRFTTSVQRALASIHAGEFEKIVLARSEIYENPKPLAPLAALGLMRERFWGCTCFSFASDQGVSFTGATPECLLAVRGTELVTHALAGSTARGKTAQEDADLGRALIESKKDRHEQELVRQAIVGRLEELGVKTESSRTPRLLKLSNIQHLNTRIEGTIPEEVDFFSLLEVLHPTPAVGGSPRNATVERIAEFEGIDRGLFAGAIGFVSHNGDGAGFVAIRSGLIDGHTLKLFAGAGIVEGSIPEREFDETDLKLQAMRSIFLGDI
ncbi:MAG: isochorismate synthase [Opitutales bacterium]|nr:isochorismate synthase [Opitutales bacterium]